jgi:hypothetical protein
LVKRRGTTIGKVDCVHQSLSRPWESYSFRETTRDGWRANGEQGNTRPRPMGKKKR